MAATKHKWSRLKAATEAGQAEAAAATTRRDNELLIVLHVVGRAVVQILLPHTVGRRKRRQLVEQVDKGDTKDALQKSRVWLSLLLKGI